MVSRGIHDAYIEQLLGECGNRSKTEIDVKNALSTYTELKPTRDTYVFNDGKSQGLLCLHGTIPIMFRGNRYNIPICIWIMDTHPTNPPICYVRPDSTMQIKPSKHVDANGMVYLPYLHEWRANKSNLTGLIEVMTVVFGEDSPVYTKETAPISQRLSYPSNAIGGTQRPFSYIEHSQTSTGTGNTQHQSSPRSSQRPASVGYPITYPGSSASPSRPRTAGTAKKPDTDGEEKDCSICFDAPANAVFYKCGHNCCCFECANKMRGGKCPMCRAAIDDVIKMYTS